MRDSCTLFLRSISDRACDGCVMAFDKSGFHPVACRCIIAPHLRIDCLDRCGDCILWCRLCDGPDAAIFFRFFELPRHLKRPLVWAFGRCSDCRYLESVDDRVAPPSGDLLHGRQLCSLDPVRSLKLADTAARDPSTHHMSRLRNHVGPIFFIQRMRGRPGRQNKHLELPLDRHHSFGRICRMERGPQSENDSWDIVGCAWRKYREQKVQACWCG